jgi:hypothetical protein
MFVMETRRIVGAFVFLCVASSAAIAQRGMGGGGRGMGGGMGRGKVGDLTRESAIVIPKYVNPVNLLIEHRQELTLTDSQFAHVVIIKRALDSANTPLVRRLDSLQRLFKGGTPIFSSPSPERRDSIATARAVVQETIGNVRENVSAARDKAYGLLSYPQRTRAQELEDKAEKVIADEKEEGAGGRSGRGGGRPPTY